MFQIRKNNFKILKYFFTVVLIWIIFYQFIHHANLKSSKLKRNIQRLEDDFKFKIVRKKYDINCKSIFEMNKNEIDKSKKLLKNLRSDQQNLASLADKNFIFEQKKCDDFKIIRAYNRYILNDIELNIPFAYSILVYNNVEQFERLLNLIYRSQNIYCIHVDSKSSEIVKNAIRSIANCFDNVFIATKLEYVVYASYSRLQADINCMNDLLSLDDLINVKRNENLIGKRVVDWKYFINMASSEFPLRTNYELARILAMYNGSSEIEIIKKINLKRIKISWIVNNKTGQLYSKMKAKTEPPHGFKIVKGYAYCVLYRNFVEYAVKSKYSKDLLEWSKDTWSPDEWFWSTLQFNTHLYPFSGFKDEAGKERISTIARFAGWGGEYKCKGKWRNGVCVFSIEDLPEMITRPHFVANKFLLDYDPISYQCMEEWFNERVSLNQTINMYFYCSFLSPHSTLANCPKI